MEFTVIKEFRGEIAALAGAGLWAISATVYTIVGAKIPPLLLNLSKGLIAIALILLTFLLTRHQFTQINTIAIFGLLISGATGIGIGDTAFFQALNHLGARKSLLFDTLAPPITALLAFIFIQEKLNSNVWIAMFITISGVAWVISERTPEITHRPTQVIKGIQWALVGVLSQAVAGVIARYTLLTTEVTSLESAFIRLLGGTIIILILMASKRQPIFSLATKIASLKLVATIAVTAFGSTYLGIWLQQTAFKHSPVGIAQTLLATSPLFVLPIVVILGERISYRAILGALVALIGVSLLFS